MLAEFASSILGKTVASSPYLAVDGELAETDVLARFAQRIRSGIGRGREVVIESGPLETLASVLASWATNTSAIVVRSSTPQPTLSWLNDLTGVEGVDAREALGLLTSGTTGAPKAVALPISSVRLNIEAIGRWLRLSEEDSVLCAAPLGHSFGLVGMALVALYWGANLHLRRPSTPPPILQSEIRKGGLTVVQGAPAFFRLLDSYWNGRPFESVRQVLVAGEFVESDLRQAISAMFPAASLTLGYGMTESGPRVSHVDLGTPGIDDGLVGKPFDHWEVAAVGGVRGDQLALRGDSLMLGYMEPAGYTGVADDGWFVSQDLVEIGSGGSLWIKGRVDRVFKRAGALVNPALIERTALEAPGVLDARCVSEQDAIAGQVPVLTVRLAMDADPAEVHAWCEGNLEKPSIPARIEVTSSPLPPRKGPVIPR